MEQRFPSQVAKNAVFATTYISFGLDLPPFDNINIRRAFQAAITAQAVFDPEKAKKCMVDAGYPNGQGFPEVEIWYRDQGGDNGAISGPMLQYLQA